MTTANYKFAKAVSRSEQSGYVSVERGFGLVAKDQLLIFLDLKIIKMVLFVKKNMMIEIGKNPKHERLKIVKII
jgi:hypothetical protein